MAKFMMLYKGEATAPGDMSEEAVQAEMAAWGAWMGKVGPAITDMGLPFGAATSAVDDGTEGTAVRLNGYTIVEADDLAGAVALTDGHPFLRDANGEFAIDVYELMPMPGL